MRNMKRKNARMQTPVVLNEGEAAIVFRQGGLQLVLPNQAPDALHIKMAIAIAMRTGDPSWLDELFQWAKATDYGATEGKGLPGNPEMLEPVWALETAGTVQ